MAAKTIKAGEAFLELFIKDSQFHRSLDRSIRRLKDLGASFKAIGSFGIAGGGLAGLQRALTLIAGSAAVTWPVELAANMELAEAAFTAMTGSANKARTILGGLLRFSGQSSFSFDQLQIAARNMLQFGVVAENVMPTLRALAAISVGNADQLDRLSVAFGQVQAKGRLMAEEVRQMVNAGFNPLQEIARTTGRRMSDLIKDMEAGRVSAGQVAAAFESAVAPGGRFHRILELIEKTAIGQFRKLGAAIKIAVLPLGQELLPSIVGVLRRVNELAPAIQRFIRANASWAKVVASTSLAVAALAGTLFSIGVAIQVVAFAAGGLQTAFLVMVNPVTAIGTALAGLSVLFVKFTEVGQAAIKFLGQRFGVLAEIAGLTFESISDALAGGSIQAAANVLWAGLNLAWLQGTAELTEFWLNFKNETLKITTEIVFGALSIWATFVSSLKGLWASLVTESRTVGEQIGHALTRSNDPELAADQDAAHRQALAIIAQEGAAKQAQIKSDLDAQLAAIQANRLAAKQDRSAQLDADLRALKARQDAAKRAFDAARDAASRARPPADKFKDLDPVLPFLENFQGALGLGSRSTFSGKLAQQIFGPSGGQDIQKKQLDAQIDAKEFLRDINRKIQRIRNGGFLFDAN